MLVQCADGDDFYSHNSSPAGDEFLSPADRCINQPRDIDRIDMFYVVNAEFLLYSVTQGNAKI